MRPFADITPFSSVDWPNHLVATLFTQGCPLRCPYCYNADMQPTADGLINTGHRSWSDVQKFIITRAGLLDGVIFSGGEPLIHSELPIWIDWCKHHGFKVGIHTSGVLPRALDRVLPHLDWVGIDFKAPFDKYDDFCTTPNSGNAVKTSLELVVNSEVPYEIRTVYDHKLLTLSNIKEMRDVLLTMDAKKWTIKPRLFF